MKTGISSEGIAIGLAALACAPAAIRAAEPVDYFRDVAPLLRQYCAGCHNDEDYEGDFSVERFADLKEGGSKGTMLKPGAPGESHLIALLTGKTKEPMPPKDEPQPAAGEIALLERWIGEGARGPATDAEDVSILSRLTVPALPAAPGEKPVTAIAVGRAKGGGEARTARARYGRIELTGAGVPAIEGLPGKVNSLEFSPVRENWLVSASGVSGLNGVATIWDISTGKPIRSFGEGYHRDILFDAVFSPDGTLLATAGYDRKIAIWKADSGERLRTIEVHNGAIYDLAFSPDGGVLASASGDSTVKLWRVSDGERLDTLNQPQGEQYAVAFSPDGKHLFAAGADNRVRMYRFVSRDKPQINPLLRARYAHEGAVIALSMSPDGRWLVTSGEDRAVKVWSLPDLQQRRAWEDGSDVAAVVAAGPGPREFFAARMDGPVETLRFDDSTLLGARLNPVGSPAKTLAPPPETPPADPEAPKPFDAPESVEPIAVDWPVEIAGVIGEPGDADDYRFRAKAGERLIFEVNAARMKSPLDSRIEVLTAAGEPVEQVRLQAVRDSWFEFRGKDSSQVTDFRVFNWREMELNEYLYCNGEVVKLWLYPRGPDSGFTVYPGFGTRRTYFNTSGLSHALGEPCHVVKPLAAGAEPVPNGLPVYTLYCENDDDPSRRFGADSVLDFVAPADGDYRIRLRDVRGAGGGDFAYRLTIRRPAPGFSVKLEGAPAKFAIAPGSGREFVVRAERFDGFEGAVEVEVAGLPPGFTASSPVTIEPGQSQAMGVINVLSGAAVPGADATKGVKLTASAEVGGKTVGRPVEGAFGEVSLNDKPAKVIVEIRPDGDSGSPRNVPEPGAGEGAPMELTLHPGETITAMVRATRIDFKDRVEFGTDDSGRNLAHGLIIDNIGLNGLMIPEDATEQRFFITAADWVPESTRYFHLRTKNADGQATRPIVLHIRKRGAVAADN
ncbi:MAG: hypothetical protein H7A53_13260 [Akkermansiaceae bacterium]|nr:hypothetical protein [Akkermansiaceae bacterium]MCP5551849.1 hypothetical protein [Akkermansiaceae bacterium]